MALISRRTVAIIGAVAVAGSALIASEATPETDFIAKITSNADLLKRTGLNKLSPGEQRELGLFIRGVFVEGVAAGKTAAKPLAEPRQSADVALASRVDDATDDIVKLRNGAVLEITSGYAGSARSGRDCVLFRIAGRWQLWVEGGRILRCNLLREATTGGAGKMVPREAALDSVSDDGDIIVTTDGSVYQVDILDAMHTMLWMPPSRLLLLDEREAINLDDGDQKVRVEKLR